MKLLKRRLVVFLLLLLPLGAHAGLLDTILRLVPRAQPSQALRAFTRQLPGNSDVLLPLFDINNNPNEEEAVPYFEPEQNESFLHFLPELPEFLYRFSYVELPNGRSDLEGGGAPFDDHFDDEDRQSYMRQLARTAGIVETVASLQAMNYDGGMINLNRVQSVLAEGSPEFGMAAVIDRAIRRVGFSDDDGLVPYDVYRDFVEQVRGDPLSFIDGTGDSFNDID